MIFMKALALSAPSPNGEWASFIQNLQWLGIPYMMHHGNLPKDPWQAILTGQGFNLTSAACFYCQVGDIQFVFVAGQAFWTVNPDAPKDPAGHEGHGPRSPLLFMRNAVTGEVQPRVFHPKGPDQVNMPTCTGARALARQYGLEHVIDSPGYRVQ